jgi:hypothetical protein
MDLALPAATLLLSLICTQPFADMLFILEIRGRRTDLSILAGSSSSPPAPALSDDVALIADATGTGVERTREGLLAALPCLSPESICAYTAMDTFLFSVAA